MQTSNSGEVSFQYIVSVAFLSPGHRNWLLSYDALPFSNWIQVSDQQQSTPMRNQPSRSSMRSNIFSPLSPVSSLVSSNPTCGNSTPPTIGSTSDDDISLLCEPVLDSQFRIPKIWRPTIMHACHAPPPSLRKISKKLLTTVHLCEMR